MFFKIFPLKNQNKRLDSILPLEKNVRKMLILGWASYRPIFNSLLDQIYLELNLKPKKNYNATSQSINFAGESLTSKFTASFITFSKKTLNLFLSNKQTTFLQTLFSLISHKAFHICCQQALVLGLHRFVLLIYYVWLFSFCSLV